MTIQEAEEKLKEAANGKYCCVECIVNNFPSGHREVKYAAYIDGGTHTYYGRNFEDAINKAIADSNAPFPEEPEINDQEAENVPSSEMCVAG